jgi:negative regulator of flagellin synthesis FlgM
MQINGTTHVHGPHGINAPHMTPRGQAARSANAPSGADRVEISPAAAAAAEAAEGGGMRMELVNQIRAQIANGTYETPDKLSMAVDRLLDAVG